MDMEREGRRRRMDFTEQRELKVIYIGTPLYGYCGGIFGRDSYNKKRIEAIGHDWLVVRDTNEVPDFASFSSMEEMVNFVAKYSSKKEKEQWEEE
jgi:hypothetical protein